MITETGLAESATRGVAGLLAADPLLFDLLEQEHRRQHATLAMIASASAADASVLACLGSSLGNLTTEGYPGARFHAGCAVADSVERLAVDRARHVFGAQYANVQPHSGTSANQIVLTSLLRPGDTLLGQRLTAGGHLTHGAPPSFTGRYFRGIGYGVDADGYLDYAEIRRLALTHRPKVIVCGASAYPRLIDFGRFRAIADEIGAYLLADISHIAGLVAAGLHPSPVNAAHITTSSTYKQLYGPRGGVILMGGDADAPGPDGNRTLAQTIDDGVFPYFQGTPQLNAIAAKARAFGIVGAPSFRDLARQVLSTASALARELADRGWHVLTGGTDNHMVVVDVSRRGLTGVAAEAALESCGIVVNKNQIPGDTKGPRVASGLRFGTNTLALRGMDTTAIGLCADLVDQVCRAILMRGDRDFDLPGRVRADVTERVARLCRDYPLPTTSGAIHD
ncbi:serine hydroxymethyltransferase [Nonomuraea sp. NPDC004186]